MAPLVDPTDDWPAFLPECVLGAEQVVLLVLDGLGWNQLCDRTMLAPTMASMDGRAITTVAPSTTATALTSIATGMAPGEHGVIGYRMAVGRSVLNVLRWSVDGRDARTTIPPASIQANDPFLGQRPVVITRSEFTDTGFTRAHLDRTRLRGWRVASSIVVEVADALRRNEPFVYAYYDGIDKIAHEFGLGAHYDAEVAAADRLVAELRAVLPEGAVLVVTSDHGQVDVADDLVEPDPAVLSHVDLQSGEGRFRWLHARPGRARGLHEEAAARHSDRAWVVTREQVVDEGWLGRRVTDAALARLGDVALVPRDTAAFVDPADGGSIRLVARHGSLTADEMYVPLLAAVGGRQH
jgi:hypothetical protein